MLGFYKYSGVVRSSIGMFATLAIMLEVVVLIYLNNRKKKKRYQTLQELLIFFYLIVLTLLLAEVQLHAADGWIQGGGYGRSRYILFGLLVGNSLWVWTKEKLLYALVPL